MLPRLHRRFRNRVSFRASSAQFAAKQVVPWAGRCLLLLALAAAVPLRAQLAPSPDASPISNAPAQTEEKPMTTLRVNVNLVSLYFTAKDDHGELVPHLTRQDCKVSEDKQPQTLKSFQAVTNQPLTLGLLLDTSGSQQRVLPLEQQFGSEFLDRVLKRQDQAFLVSFDVNVDLLQDFTNSPRELERAMDKAQINIGGGSYGVPGIGGGPVPTSGAPKGTLLYDAIDQVSNDKLSVQTGRKAVILLTDGEDQGSSVKIADAIAAAQKANVIVYVILIADRGFYNGFGYGGDFAMRRIANETGGRLIDVGNNGKKLEAAFQQIEDELRTQYIASYTPTNQHFNGEYRHVAVSCQSEPSGADKAQDLHVQVRQGYYAIPTPPDANN